jgi:glutaredoxin-related protein
MKYFIILSLITSIFVLCSCDIKTSSTSPKSISKDSSVVSLKTVFTRQIDSTLVFKNENYSYKFSQLIIKEEALKVQFGDDTIYCNRENIDLIILKNSEYFVSQRYTTSIFELMLDEPLDSVVWGFTGIDSLTANGVYVTIILFKPANNNFYYLRFSSDFLGNKSTQRISGNKTDSTYTMFNSRIDKEKVQIHPSLPPYYVYLHIRDDLMWVYYDSIKIVGTNNKLIQLIRLRDIQNDEDELSMLKVRAGDLEYEDMNFDGYLDMRLFLSGGSSNYLYDYWLYNPKSNKFIYNRVLSDLTNLYADTVKRELHSYSRSGWAEHDERTYKYYNNKPKLIERTYTYGVYTKKPPLEVEYQIEKKYALRNGELQLISTRKINRDD